MRSKHTSTHTTVPSHQAIIICQQQLALGSARAHTAMHCLHNSSGRDRTRAPHSLGWPVQSRELGVGDAPWPLQAVKTHLCWHVCLQGLCTHHGPGMTKVLHGRVCGAAVRENASPSRCACLHVMVHGRVHLCKPLCSHACVHCPLVWTSGAQA